MHHGLFIVGLMVAMQAAHMLSELHGRDTAARKRNDRRTAYR